MHKCYYDKFHNAEIPSNDVILMKVTVLNITMLNGIFIVQAIVIMIMNYDCKTFIVQATVLFANGIRVKMYFLDINVINVCFQLKPSLIFEGKAEH